MALAYGPGHGPGPWPMAQAHNPWPMALAHSLWPMAQWPGQGCWLGPRRKACMAQSNGRAIDCPRRWYRLCRSVYSTNNGLNRPNPAAPAGPRPHRGELDTHSTLPPARTLEPCSAYAACAFPCPSPRSPALRPIAHRRKQSCHGLTRSPRGGIAHLLLTYCSLIAHL